jgi:AhpD family alkylhydroperoxidase
MARLQGVQDGKGGWFARYAFRESRRRTGKVMTSLRITLLHPGLTVGVGAMERQLDRAKDVDPLLTELASLKAATIVGCEFCIDIGSFIARTEHGATEEQIRDLHRHRESPAFDARQRLVLDYAEAMSQTPLRVDDQLFAALREEFTEKQLVALTGAIAWEQYRARFNGAFDIGPDGFTEGGVCAMAISDPLGAGAPVTGSAA